MQALQKEPLSSDSEDEDYVPPEPGVKEPTLSLRKRSGGLELESDEDGDDDDDDDLSDDADLVDTEVAQLYASANGAGPSSAGPSSAGPSSAGPSSAGPSSAGPSSAGPGPSSFGAGPSCAGGEPSGAGAASSSAGAASISAVGSSAPAGSSAEASTTLKPGSSVQPDGSVLAASAAAGGSSSAVGSDTSKQTVKATEATPVAENGAPGAKVEEPIAKKPRVETAAENKSIDDIWADMNAGVTHTKQPTTTPDAGLAAWLEPSPPPKKEFKVTRLSDLEKAVQREEPTTKKKGRTGLEGVLDVVRGKSERVIEKTKEQWKEFKKDEDVNDELEKYKKDKDRYTDKVAFLQRTDVREWEYEQRGKRRR